MKATNTVETKEQYDAVIAKRFPSVRQDLRDAASSIGLALHKGDKVAAKECFNAFCIKNKLVLWEQIALSDYASIEQVAFDKGIKSQPTKGD